MFKIGSIFLDVSEICKKTAYQILIKICPIETCTITSKSMTLDKLFIMKQSIMRESNRNLDIPPTGIPGEFACLVFEEGGNLTFFSSGRWGICLGGQEFEFFF
jgi:hypothetical protein